MGRWDDTTAEVVQIALPDLESIVASFERQPVYGMEFFDPPESAWAEARDRLSVDERWADGHADHAVCLCQESLTGPDRFLEVRIEFVAIDGIFDAETGNGVSVEEFVEGARRWWEGLRAGDARTSKSLIRAQVRRLFAAFRDVAVRQFVPVFGERRAR